MSIEARESSRGQAPVGAVTMLLTDLEGSTRLARETGPGWGTLLADHNRLIGEAVRGNGGWVVQTTGDGVLALFREPPAAARAAVAAQHALCTHDWPAPVRVRMGLHSGTVERDEHGYMGIDIHLTARVEDAGHGGQILLTAAVAEQLDPAEFALAELGEHRLKDFPAPEPLWQLVHDGRGPDAFPALRTQAVRPTNLPADPRPLLGRERELDELAALLGNGTRLVTVLGLGGSGKTRLALSAGEGLLSQFAGGVWLVRFAGVREQSAVVPSIAAALGVSDAVETSLEDAVADRLRSRPTLLILDNLEHLVDSGPVIAGLLQGAPDVRMLVTSQLPLHVQAEHVYRLGPLELDAATTLFAERARAVLPDFALEPHRDAVDSICARVGGIPLGVELAAARVAVMTPADIDARLERSTGLLARGPRDLPERHRSLRATLEWAHDLLTPEERRLFARLAAFAGPVPLDAVEAVGGADALDALSGLIDASLAQRFDHRDFGVRYTVPQAARDFAAEHLAASGEEHAVRTAHGAHVASVAETCRFWFPGHRDEVRARVRAIELEERLAVSWARDHDPELHLRLVSAFALKMTRSGRMREAHTELGIALGRFGINGPEAGWAAIDFHWACLTLREDPGPHNVEAGIAAVRSSGDDKLLELALRCASVVLTFAGDPERGSEAGVEAVAIGRRHDDVTALAADLVFSASALVMAGDLDAAEQAIAEADRLAPLAGDSTNCVATVRGDVEFQRGDFAAAARSYAESARMSELVNSHEQLHIDLALLSQSLMGLGRDDDALEVHELVVRVGEQTGIDLGLLDQLGARERAIETRERVGPARADAAVQRGRAVPDAGLVERALELAG